MTSVSRSPPLAIAESEASVAPSSAEGAGSAASTGAGVGGAIVTSASAESGAGEGVGGTVGVLGQPRSRAARRARMGVFIAAAYHIGLVAHAR